VNDVKDNMQKLILTSLIVALFSGLAIGVQSSLISAAGKNTGALLTGLLVNALAGVAAGLLMVWLWSMFDKDILPSLQSKLQR
jgi:hypothetical protein